VRRVPVLISRFDPKKTENTTNTITTINRREERRDKLEAHSDLDCLSPLRGFLAKHLNERLTPSRSNTTTLRALTSKEDYQGIDRGLALDACVEIYNASTQETKLAALARFAREWKQQRIESSVDESTPLLPFFTALYWSLIPFKNGIAQTIFLK